MQRWILKWGFLTVLACGACGGSGKGGSTTVEARRPDIDTDPFILLPGSAIVIANFDARRMFDGGSVGAHIATLSNSLVPFAEGADFRPSRDLDRVVVAAYSATGADLVAVLSGRFDEAKIAAMKNGAGGADIVRGTYAGRTTYSVGNIAYAVLTSKTVVAGTSDGLRRVLERVQTGTLDRSMPPWVVATMATKGADIAVAADFVTQPLVAAAVGSMSVPWLKGLRTARVIGNFDSPGMNVAATLSYGEPPLAHAAEEGLRKAEGWLRVIGPLLGGIRLQDLETTVDGNDTRCRFAVDEHSLNALLAILPRFIPTAP